jgi:hypothetical protein
MKVTTRHLKAEMKYLERVVAVIDRQGSVADKAMHERLKEVGEVKKYLWERAREMDFAELADHKRSATLEMRKVESKHRFLAKLSKARKSPFFGRLDFKDESGDAEKLYIGLMQIDEDHQFYVYDWRAPISSMFLRFWAGHRILRSPVWKNQRDNFPRRKAISSSSDSVMTRVLRYGPGWWTPSNLQEGAVPAIRPPRREKHIVTHQYQQRANKPDHSEYRGTNS